MASGRYSVSRQKACHQCSASKAKCDRVETGCSRCVRRELRCVYTQPTPNRGAWQSSLNNERVRPTTEYTGAGAAVDTANSSGNDSTHTRFGAEPHVPSPSMSTPGSRHSPDSIGIATFRHVAGFDIRGFTDLKLTCPINADQIGNRWLGAYIPLPDQKPKEYPDATKSFLHRMVKSYVTMTIRGRGYPPFIHASQVATHLIRPPLSTCLSLVRICEHQLPGSEETAANVLQQEMSHIQEKLETYDTITLLCAFQAYLIYTMVLFFRLEQITNSILRQAVMNLQDIACASAKRGLVCEAEQQWLRPQWESWIVAEACRRTLYTMYFFDGVLSAHDGLPTFVGTELTGLPAPANQSLWRAQVRFDWEASYNLHLADWSEGGLRIDELWRVPEDFQDTDVIKRRNRVDHWLEGVDEFGTMLYAVTSATHG